MSDLATTAPDQVASRTPAWQTPIRRLRDLVAQTEVDLRLFGMVAALAVILVAIEMASPQVFLRAENLLNLTVQAAPVAIIATGMVLVIVSRNIDLAVGSMVGVIAMTDAILFFRVFPGTIGVDSTFGWL